MALGHDPIHRRRLLTLGWSTALLFTTLGIAGSGISPNPTECSFQFLGKPSETFNEHADRGHNAEYPTVIPRRIRIQAGHGHLEFATPSSNSRTLLIVSSLAINPGPHAVTVSAKSIDRAVVEPDPVEPAGDKPEHGRCPYPPLRSLQPAPNRSAALANPPAQRTFHLMVRDGDVASAANYTAVPARLRAIGEHVQIYVDEKDSANVKPEFLRDIVETFDDKILPSVARALGTARDVDDDRRFTVFVSGWLTHLADGRYKVDGFVRGADFDLRLAAPFSNRSDMLYLSASLSAGDHLKTILAHEYAHAITLRHKSTSSGSAIKAAGDEEGWLDEGLAHLVEDQFAFSRTNLDYRVSAFLSCPERYRLVVADYYAADLFRAHGNRGGTYLFLRYCADRFGPSFVEAMIRSPLRGIVNLEAATGRDFAELYRDWTVALAGQSLAQDHRPSADRRLQVLGSFGDHTLAGPRMSRIRMTERSVTNTITCSLAGTSSAFVVVSGVGGGGIAVDLKGPESAKLQVTAIDLPEDSPELELWADLAPGGEPGSRSVRLKIFEHAGQTTHFDDLVWEPLVPSQSEASRRIRHKLGKSELATALGSLRIEPKGIMVAKRLVSLPGVTDRDGPIVFKLIGHDDHGRPVSAWAEVQMKESQDDDELVRTKSDR